MKLTMTVEGCPYEEREGLHIYMHAMDYYSVVIDARDAIRARLKYEEGITDEEERFLEELQDLLRVDLES